MQRPSNARCPVQFVGAVPHTSRATNAHSVCVWTRGCCRFLLQQRPTQNPLGAGEVGNTWVSCRSPWATGMVGPCGAGHSVWVPVVGRFKRSSDGRGVLCHDKYKTTHRVRASPGATVTGRPRGGCHPATPALRCPTLPGGCCCRELSRRLEASVLPTRLRPVLLAPL